ncbi:hypothetical protein LINPERPRIM_LOCUS37033 [Linum perenne]
MSLLRSTVVQTLLTSSASASSLIGLVLTCTSSSFHY